MSGLVIFGTGGFGREVHELVQDVNDDTGGTWEVLGFLDGDRARHGTQVHGLPVVGGVDWLTRHRDVEVALGVGAPAVKAKVVPALRSVGARFATVVHPRATVGRTVRLGAAAVVCAGTILTTDVVVGDFVTLNLDLTVGHDTRIGDYATLAPGAHVSGAVTIGAGVDVGTGTTFVQGTNVGEGTVLGAGAVVAGDVPANVTAVGVPARVIRERTPGWWRPGSEEL